MKILANIPGALKFVRCLKYFKAYGRQIDAARAAGDTEKEREYILKSTSLWGSKIMEMFGSSVNVRGLENLPDSGPVVMVGNHQGYADIFAYFAAFTKFQFGFVAKEALGKLPFYGKWIGKIRSVFIERGDHRGIPQSHKQRHRVYRAGVLSGNFSGGDQKQGPCSRPISERSSQACHKARRPHNTCFHKRELQDVRGRRPPQRR